MAESSRKACTQCRARKVRCDGNRPVCGACSKSSRQTVQCEYILTSERPAAAIEKGSACLPCRRKKKRCKGERPFCSTCHSVGKASECVFEDSQSTVEQPIMDLSLDGVDMELLDYLGEYRRLFMHHSGQCCISLMGMRIIAILQGETSTTLVHPALIHVIHLCGFVIWQERNARFSVGTEDYLRQIAEDALARFEAEGDRGQPNWICTRVHVYCAMAGYHLWGRRIQPYLEYLKNAAEVVNTIDVKSIIDNFLATDNSVSRSQNGPSVEAHTTAEEAVCAVAKVVYLDRTTSASLNLEPVVDRSVVTQLQRLQCSPFWRLSVTLMRAQSSYLLHMVRVITKEWYQGDMSEEARVDRQRRYWELLNATTDHGGVLEVAIIRASFAAHVEQITPLRSALVNVLAAKALMHHLLLDHDDSRQKALNTVRLIHLLIGRLREDCIEFLDHVIGVTLMLVLRIVLWERKIGKESPLKALVDDVWLRQTASEIVRVLLHSEIKLPFAVRAREMVCTLDDDDSERFLREVANAL